MRLLRREVSLASAAARVQPRLHQVPRLPHRRLGCQAPERRGKRRRKLNRVLPPELRYSKEEAEELLDFLRNKNERLFVYTGLVYTYADSLEG